MAIGLLLTSYTFDKACGPWQNTQRPFPPAHPGNMRRSSAIPQAVRRSGGRPGHRALFLATRIEEAPRGREWRRLCSSTAWNHHPGEPAARIAFYTHCALGQPEAGGQYIWAIERPICAR
jgi:hypothetical protein